MTILEEARHSLIIIEHDPLLYENAQGMVEYVSQGLHDAAKEAAVLLYSPGTDTFLEDMTRNADRISISTRDLELQRSLFRKLIQKRRRARERLRPGHDQIAVEAWS
jgi:DNA polymerase I